MSAGGSAQDVSDRNTLLASGAALLLIVCAAGIVVDGVTRSPEAEARSRRFQRLTGGIGGGAAVDLTRGAATYDARLDETPLASHRPMQTLGTRLTTAARQDD